MPTVIDHTAFPHVVESIFKYVPPGPGQAALRATCKKAHIDVDHRSRFHLALFDFCFPGDTPVNAHSTVCIASPALRRMPWAANVVVHRYSEDMAFQWWSGLVVVLDMVDLTGLNGKLWDGVFFQYFLNVTHLRIRFSDEQLVDIRRMPKVRVLIVFPFKSRYEHCSDMSPGMVSWWLPPTTEKIVLHLAPYSAVMLYADEVIRTKPCHLSEYVYIIHYPAGPWTATSTLGPMQEELEMLADSIVRIGVYDLHRFPRQPSRITVVDLPPELHRAFVLQMKTKPEREAWRPIPPGRDEVAEAVWFTTSDVYVEEAHVIDLEEDACAVY